MSIIRRFHDCVARLLFFNGHGNSRLLIMTQFAVRRGKMEIRGATNRGNRTTKIMDLRGWDGVCAVGKINQAAGSRVGFRCDGSRVHDLWTPRHFRPKIHYILHLARRGDASPKVMKALARLRSPWAVLSVTLIELSRTTAAFDGSA